MGEEYTRMIDLLGKVNDPMFGAFFDVSSEDLLDEKIEVLEALIAGKPPAEIPNYYKILELLPDDNTHWDL